MSESNLLVVGGGPAGMAASLAARQLGVKTLLLERSEALGGTPIRLGYGTALTPLINQVTVDREIEVRSKTTLMRLSGEPGQFVAQLTDGTQFECGAVVVATGIRPFDASLKPELGYNYYEDVLVAPQLDQMLATESVVRPSDGRAPERIGFLLCVGSRDRQIERPWCSKVCCSSSLRQAIRVRELAPQCDTVIFYTDIRTSGLEETLYRNAQEQHGVRFIRSRIATIATNGDGRLLLAGEDTLLQQPFRMPFDLVVLAIGMDPTAGEIAQLLDLRREESGFLSRADPLLMPTATTRSGIFAAGGCLGPGPIDEAITQGQAAAVAAITSINSA